ASGGGAPIAAASARTVPGDAIASSIARKAACVASTEFGGPAELAGDASTVDISVLPAHQREEVDLRGGGLLGLAAARRPEAGADRCHHLVFHGGAIASALHQCVAQGDEMRLVAVAAEHVADAGLAALQPHRGA